METEVNNKLRLPMTLKLFFNGEVVLSTSRTKKSAIRALLEREQTPEWNLARLRVWYSKPNQYWNEVDCLTKEALLENLTTLTELDLVRDFT